ncbi:glycosyltransferase WbuB, partial [Oleiphilus sp. HI0123]
MKAFRELGHEVELLSLPGADPDAEDSSASREKTTVQKTNIVSTLLSRIIELTKYAPEFVFEFIELAYNLIAFFRVNKVVCRDQPDFLYERYSLFMFAGVLIARMKNVPIILEVNDSAIVERVRPLFFKCLARRIEAWIFKNSNGIVFISTNFKNTVESQYANIAPSIICPNAADVRQFNLDGIDREAAKSSLGLSGQVVCGYVGAFVHWHGIDWFVKEISPKLSGYPQLSLLLVGDGVVYEDIQSVVQQYGIEEQVIMPGRVPHTEVSSYIAAMDYGILPDSNEYGSPMKLFEMMAMEVALVSPDFEPIAEVVSDNENGWLFTRKDKA